MRRREQLRARNSVQSRSSRTDLATASFRQPSPAESSPGPRSTHTPAERWAERRNRHGPQTQGQGESRSRGPPRAGRAGANPGTGSPRVAGAQSTGTHRTSRTHAETLGFGNTVPDRI